MEKLKKILTAIFNSKRQQNNIAELFTERQKAFLRTIKGWKVVLHGDHVELIPELKSGYDGRQIISDIETFEDLVNKVNRIRFTFDASTEAYRWLDRKGHGKHGAPESMGAVFFSMEELEGQLQVLSDSLSQFWEEENEEEFESVVATA